MKNFGNKAFRSPATGPTIRTNLDPMPSHVLPPEEWTARRSLHERRVAPWIDSHLERSARGEPHPIYDFLFEYYSYRPSCLRRWHPGIGLILAGSEAEPYLAFTSYRRHLDGVAATPDALKVERFRFVRWLLDLLEATRDRPPFFGCAGLHEWAMVYRTTQVRHPRWPLRLGPEATSRLVDSLPVRCSHFDAFRFFTPPARSLNRLRPTRESASQFEQPGCLHANMDLYKWSYKLAPFVPSELVADAFALARDIREIDMRASPYDFTELGFAPIAIETAIGRDEYESFQRGFFPRAQSIRAKLIEICQALLTAQATAPKVMPP